jgi:hypothetical protein
MVMINMVMSMMIGDGNVNGGDYVGDNDGGGSHGGDDDRHSNYWR